MSEQPQAAPGGPGRAGHPELEDLAALIDGRLPTAEAAWVRGHLASCEDCYEVFTETLHLQEELRDEERPEGDVVPFPFEGRRKVRPLWAAAVAALLVVGVGVGIWWTEHTREATPDFSVAGLATPLSSQFKDLGKVAWGERTRGAGTPEDRDVSFRVGVEVFNLQLALESQDGTTADSATAALNGLLESSLYLENRIKDFYKGLRSDIDRAKAPQGLARLARKAAEEADALRGSESFERLELDLGVWAEAGRLAAISKEPAFFHGKKAGDLLAQLRQEKAKDKEADLPSEVVTAMETFDSARSKDKLTADDYSALKTAFENILNHYYPQGRPYEG